MKKILFISWDGASTTYMEGLFMPIFRAITNILPVEFHVIQFTSKSADNIKAIKQSATEKGICYTPFTFSSGLFGTVSSFIALFTATTKINRYIKKHQIDIVMPRSNLTASMVYKIKNGAFKIIFDADGLPIEERIDFTGLSKKSKNYKWRKRQEIAMLLKADKVITRSQKAIEFHLKNIGEQYRHKFSVVYNGRDTEFFKPDVNNRFVERKKLGFCDNEMVFIYCGSLGIQYCWEEMLAIFSLFSRRHPAKWLILTVNSSFIERRIPEDLKNKIFVKTVPFNLVPSYLNTGDVAFAIRKPTFSMQGVAPIKLGEYLLIGLPTIASKGIGDTDIYLKDVKDCFIYEHDVNGEPERAVKWLENLKNPNQKAIREKAFTYFSLEAAAKSYLPALSGLAHTSKSIA